MQDFADIAHDPRLRILVQQGPRVGDSVGSNVQISQYLASK